LLVGTTLAQNVPSALLLARDLRAVRQAPAHCCEAFMETRTQIPSNPRGLLTGSATIGTILLVSGSAKAGYGVWALGIAALACIVYGAGKYAVACAVMSFLRYRSAAPFRRLREWMEKSRAIAATSCAATSIPEQGASMVSGRVPGSR
jgi:hypothetical protein